MLVLASIGRGSLVGSNEALHLISGSGQGLHDTEGHAGHAFGSGHFATGHLGLGQGGHSPILQGLEQVDTQGGQLGTDDFRTYFDISGTDGHSVFNMYRDISGMAGQGGTVDLSTHFVASGCGQGGHCIAGGLAILKELFMSGELGM